MRFLAERHLLGSFLPPWRLLGACCSRRRVVYALLQRLIEYLYTRGVSTFFHAAFTAHRADAVSRRLPGRADGYPSGSRVAGRDSSRQAPAERHVQGALHAAHALLTPRCGRGFTTANLWLWPWAWPWGWRRTRWSARAAPPWRTPHARLARPACQRCETLLADAPHAHQVPFRGAIPGVDLAEAGPYGRPPGLPRRMPPAGPPDGPRLACAWAAATARPWGGAAAAADPLPGGHLTGPRRPDL